MKYLTDYLIFEILMSFSTNSPLIWKLYFVLYAKKWANNNLPNNYTYKIPFITIGINSIFIKAIKNDDNKIWTCDYLKLNKGRIVKSGIIDNIKILDKSFSIKQFERDKKIAQLLK